MTIGRKVRLTGLVQGVVFRAWTQQQADSLGVAGWIRNCPDGSVEAQLSGDEAAVSQLIERMRRGPPGAQVAQLDVDEVAVETGEGFEIRRG